MTTLLEPVVKLDREVLGLAGLVDTDQARGLVDLYYRWQEHRIALRGQIRAIVQGADPAASTELLVHFADQVEQLERQMVRVFDEWTDTHRVGVWSKAQLGIGPVLAAGLLGHIDIEKAATAGAIWRFAGLHTGPVKLRGPGLGQLSQGRNAILPGRHGPLEPWPPAASNRRPGLEPGPGHT